MEKRAVLFHQSTPVYIKQIVEGIVYDQMEENCHIDKWQLYSMIFVLKI